MKGRMDSSRYINGTSNLTDVVEIFDKKYNKFLNDSEWQLS